MSVCVKEWKMKKRCESEIGVWNEGDGEIKTGQGEEREKKGRGSSHPSKNPIISLSVFL